MVCLLKVGPLLAFMRKTILGVAVLAPLAAEATRQESLIKRVLHRWIMHSDRCKRAIELTVICQLVLLRWQSVCKTVCHQWWYRQKADNHSLFINGGLITAVLFVPRTCRAGLKPPSPALRGCLSGSPGGSASACGNQSKQNGVSCLISYSAWGWPAAPLSSSQWWRRI